MKLKQKYDYKLLFLLSIILIITLAFIIQEKKKLKGVNYEYTK